MKDKRKIVFAVSKTGASHLPDGTPCQDYSVKVDEDGMRMVIVCDGHGSKTYVRSDVGSRLAAEVTRDTVRRFVKETPPELFFSKKGAVTVRPTVNDILWMAAHGAPTEQMAETEKMKIQQYNDFFSQVRDIREQDTILTALFRDIYTEWLKAIKQDSMDNPFSEEEKAALGGNHLVKAYGTTLIAYVETPLYWLSFHIGDGRVIHVNDQLEMTAPVPWDCNCFLNVTTSLCNSNPVRLFRYAFDGMGNFPAAVLCCSDGIEDSYGDYSLAPYYLHDWYAAVLSEFVMKGEEETLEKMEEFFPVMSQKGSKDDVSLAGIIDIKAIGKGLRAADIKTQIQETESQVKETGQKVAELNQQIEELHRQEAGLNEKKAELERQLKEIEQEPPEINESNTCNETL